MLSSRSRVLAPVAALVFGAIVGMLGPLLLSVDGPVAHVGNLVLAAGWAWAAMAFFVGLGRKSRIESAILAPASLVAGVIAYYVVEAVQGKFRMSDLRFPGGVTKFDWNGFISMMGVWSLAACVFGPLLGLAGNLARNRGLRGLPYRLVIPLVAIVDTSIRLHSDAPLEGATSTATWSVIRLLAVAAIIVLVGHATITGWFRSSTRQSRG
ncbi:DUF6518 family protein [Streptomyces sp. NPDC049577]|uniref:DUF6518 family protein n=1 Tax=Streptomyces sp. NPDC049577 TaxID=3155153 RepID=UPI0034209A1E